MPSGIIEYTLPSREWGKVMVCQVLPHGDDIWGSLASLRDTDLAAHIPIISGAAIAHAKHGWASPFMRECGPMPKRLLVRLQQEGWPCAYKVDKSCGFPKPECSPGVKSPICYEPDVPPEARDAGAYVMRAWAEGKIVCLVQGPEHNAM